MRQKKGDIAKAILLPRDSLRAKYISTNDESSIGFRKRRVKDIKMFLG
ncbi:MAG: purine-nucleoside phosphorylase [Epulopiscium sp.]|nr:purine-nucleoside phosphorylase [Candidatus Epulonipiscium sp.]